MNVKARFLEGFLRLNILSRDLLGVFFGKFKSLITISPRLVFIL